MHFSICTLLKLIGFAAVVTAIASSLGLMFVTYFLLTVANYFVMRVIRRTYQVLVISVMLLFVTLPWLGLGDGSFIVPGSSDVLPTVDLQQFGRVGRLSEDIFNGIYRIGEVPLATIQLLDDRPIARFPNSSHIRPFAFFTFYLGLLIPTVWAMVSHRVSLAKSEKSASCKKTFPTPKSGRTDDESS